MTREVADTKRVSAKMNINELRDIAEAYGINRKGCYGTSKQAMVLKIDKARREQH
jgi:hypothetical protein